MNFRVYECAILITSRAATKKAKIGWKDGVRALYCILHYGAPYAPLPMQLLLYLFIGIVCALANIGIFAILDTAGFHLLASVLIAFGMAAALNYLLCLAILFRHKARWSAKGDLAPIL